MATAINFTSTAQSGKKLNKTITDINPNATGAQLKTFAQMMNSLTTNTYGSTSRVDKDELVAASSLSTPSVIIKNRNGDTVSGPITWHKSDEEELDLCVATDSPGKLFAISVPEYSSYQFEAVSDTDEASDYFDPVPDGYFLYYLAIYCPTNDAKALGNFVFGIKEADGFAATTFTVTVSA